MTKAKPAQKIIVFFCRPCGEYHLETKFPELYG
jgi:hypothetical protein